MTGEGQARIRAKANEILTDLEQVRERLLTLSDDIWLNIEHNDSAALQQGVAFKLAFNEQLERFSALVGDLTALVEQHTGARVDAAPLPEPSPAGRGSAHRERAQRIIRELDRSQPHTLDEDFTYLRPYGYRLGEDAAKDIPTWRRLYQLVSQDLAARDPATFAGLPEHPTFISKQGNPAFARQPGELRAALPIVEGVYAEAHYSANSLRDNLRKLLPVFGLEPGELRVYVREDRDADTEGLAV